MVANGPEGDRSHASWRSQPQADCRQAAVLRAGTSRTEGGCGSPPSGVSTSCGSKWFSEAGSTIIPDTPVSPRFLTQDDRIAIADGLRAGKAPASIAAAIGKSTSTVYREIGRGKKGDGSYDSWWAQNQALLRRQRPKTEKIRDHAPLRIVIREKLNEKWSPHLVAVAAVRFPKPTEPAVARVVPPCGLCRAAYRTHPANPAGIGPFPLFV
ncbi:helix-turn-helix domain-containing protein [Streptomyces mirabilis]|uniref:helix-turn-helix domain-containing protein n=1 Tax=Streptomyces mirabilis TaxID=68239 RepID=UPI00332D490B